MYQPLTMDAMDAADARLSENREHWPATIVVATHNEHKIPEIVQALHLPDTQFQSLSALGIPDEAEEIASSFEGNAWIKAGFAFARCHQACLADDSGLEVPALGGAPGVFSARYAGEKATDAENVAKLLAAMAGRPPDQRRARFVCEIAYIAADGSELAARGVSEGYLAEAPRGEAGFGYDPIFIPDDPGDGRTLAELSATEKERVSHRGRALRALRQKLLAQQPNAERTKLAVFDFDGTLLDGASPVRLVRRLLLKRVIPPQLALKTSFWGLRYKLRMSVQQELVRSYIFSGLTELSVPEVGQLMADLYEQELKPLLRPRGLLAIQQARQDDRRIALVSASFRPIISILAREVQADFFICTEMEIQGNNYTGRVAVIPPESYHKLLQLRASADDLYGEGNWVLDSAYGDHISDSYILSAALHPFAVHPDHRLQTLAEELGWSVCYW